MGCRRTPPHGERAGGGGTIVCVSTPTRPQSLVPCRHDNGRRPRSPCRAAVGGAVGCRRAAPRGARVTPAPTPPSHHRSRRSHRDMLDHSFPCRRDTGRRRTPRASIGSRLLEARDCSRPSTARRTKFSTPVNQRRHTADTGLWTLRRVMSAWVPPPERSRSAPPLRREPTEKPRRLPALGGLRVDGSLCPPWGRRGARVTILTLAVVSPSSRPSPPQDPALLRRKKHTSLLSER